MYAFEYKRPQSVAEAVVGADGRFLAGGQSLIQAMKLGLSSSETLVDLGALIELRSIRVENGTGGERLVIGAMATHAAVAASAEVRRLCPALAELAEGIGDPMVRNLGTIGGAVANADPAACYPAGLVGLAATIHTATRAIAADAFFTGLYETALQPGEMISAVSFPAVRRAAYVKYKQPASRFALIGVFVAQTPDGVRVAVTGAKGSVFRATEIETALAASFTAEAALSVKLPTTGINSDLHGSAEYRAAMVSVMAARAVTAALAH